MVHSKGKDIKAKYKCKHRSTAEAISFIQFWRTIYALSVNVQLHPRRRPPCPICSSDSDSCELDVNIEWNNEDELAVAVTFHGRCVVQSL